MGELNVHLRMPVQSPRGESAAKVDTLITRNVDTKISPINTHVLVIAFTRKTVLALSYYSPQRTGRSPKRTPFQCINRFSMGENVGSTIFCYFLALW
jgi:hypothetical protein